MNKKYIITGAPGTGKTAIINCLKKQGFSCINEISREIIIEQIASGGDVLPWRDLEAFSERVATMRKIQYENATENNIHFFDRGIIDVIAYMKIDKIDIDKNLIEDCKKTKYANIVFYTPIWEEIYINDMERKEDIISAIKVEETLLSCYKSFGYTLIEIPKLAITQRVDFILSKI